MLSLRQNGLLLLKLDLTNMLPRPCPLYSLATAGLSVHVEAKLGTATSTQLVLSFSAPLSLNPSASLRMGAHVAELRSRSMVGGDQGEEK